MTGLYRDLGLVCGRCENDFGCWAQVPYNPAGENQANCYELRATEHSAKYRAAAGVIAQKLDKEPRDAVEEKICAENLAIELFAVEHPGEKKENAQLYGGLEKLSRLERVA